MSDDEEGQKLGGETSFDQLMKEAVALKSAQLSRLRPKFDSWPEFHQAGLYYSSNWDSLRSSSIEEQCSAFDKKKAEGIELLSQGDAQKALYRFEEALCVFRWVESRKKNWKNEGIEDDDLTIHEPAGTEPVHTRVLSAYLNISLCCIRLSNHRDAVKACDEALKLDPGNVKALYRKATSLAEPSGSDIDDYRTAIQLLKQASEHDPGNPTVWSKLLEYKEFVKAQKLKSKATFHSFFKQPIIVDGDEPPKPQPVPAPRNEADELLELGNRKLRELKADNRRQEAKELQGKLKEIERWKKGQAKAVPKKPDFENPTEAMRKVAGKGDTKDRGRTGWMKAVVVVSVAVGVYYLWPWLSSTEEDLY